MEEKYQFEKIGNIEKMQEKYQLKNKKNRKIKQELTNPCFIYRSIC